MKALHEQKQVLEEIDTLISMMGQQIGILRSLVYSYSLKYGEEIQDGLIFMTDNIDFGISKKNGKLICEVYDSEQTHIKASYQKIKETISHLS
jgi:hypothetical protein